MTGVNTVHKVRFLLFPGLLLLSGAYGAGNQSNNTLPGGGVRFQGVLIAESCRVEAGDRQMTVRMGSYSSNRFPWVGSEADPVPFDIHLQDCSTAVSQRVGLTFRGVADGKNPDVLSVGEGPGIATGVGIALYDADNNLIPLNQPLPRYWKSVHAEPVTLHMTARYRATGREVTGGAASGQVWFSLTYQ